MSPRPLPLLALLVPLACDSGKDDTGEEVIPRDVVHVTGDVTTDTTWTEDHVYVVDVPIQVTATLTLEGDAIVKFAEQASMTVSGAGVVLAGASGAAEARAATLSSPLDRSCLFTSALDDEAYGDTNEDGDATAPAPGDWGWVSVGTSGSVFHACEFRYGGWNMPYTGTLVITDDAAVTVTDCVFDRNQGGEPSDTRAAAFNASGAGPGTVIAGNTFYANDLPLVIDGDYDLDGTNVFHAEVDGSTVGNVWNGVFWGGSYETAGAVTWSVTDVPYVITGTVLGVGEGSTLTLVDGVIVKFDDGFRMDVSGVLLASGTVFTSFHDDALGGDTDGDGGATAPAPGDWAGVYVTSDGSVIDGCTFTYGGANAPYAGTLQVSEDASATITDSAFAHNAGGTLEDNRAAAVGLAGAGAATVLTGNVFYGNDMPLLINGVVSIDDSNVFHGGDGGVENLHQGIYMDGSSHSIGGAVSWGETEVAYTMCGGTVLTVQSTGTLTLGDGVVVKSDGGRIDVSGALEQGADTWFTSEKDDSLGGDANGDGTASTPAHGDWAGVNLCLGGPCAWADWGNILYAEYP